MTPAKGLFRAIGVDHITFACYDRKFWVGPLRQFGFEIVDSFIAKRKGTVALAHGDVRIMLVDPASRAYRPGNIARFLVDHGDMQVISAAILVDSLRGVENELSGHGAVNMSRRYTGPDAFGQVKRSSIRLSYPSTVTWELLERPRGASFAATGGAWKSRGVDHFAIAVADLAQWESLYHSLGFETIYVPREEIKGDYSAMKTVAVQRGGWVVALVEGVDKEKPSQVSTYQQAHGDHAIQHAAIRFDELRTSLRVLMSRGMQLRSRRLKMPGLPNEIDDVLHEGRDHSGPLFQCFTKPLARRPDPANPAQSRAGFFFELIQRISQVEKASAASPQPFHDPTVIGLYRSIEYEEMASDTGLLFPPEMIKGYRFSEWLSERRKRRLAA